MLVPQEESRGKFMKDFRQEALRESFKSNYKYQLGAILVKRGQIVGRGYNSVCYTGNERPYLNGIHAEVAAINDTRARDRTGSTLYVARYRKCGTLGCAKPCDACEKVLRKLGIKSVWYSDYGNGWKRITL
jgi:tRNA(Arg) A34 adenosine deaminase TadA